MRKLMNISILYIILSLFVLCSPEHNNIVMPEREINQEKYQKITYQANTYALRMLKQLSENDSGNLLISPLNANVVYDLLSFASSGSGKTAKKSNISPKTQVDERDLFNEWIFNLDEKFEINNETTLGFSKMPDITKGFSAFLSKHKYYKLQGRENSDQSKQFIIDFKNNLSGSFSFSNQTNISESPFYVNPNNSKFVKMLICRSVFNYYGDDNMKVVEVPIGKGNFSALFIIPETGFSLKRIIQRLNPYLLKKISNNYRKIKTAIFIPEININYDREGAENNSYIYFKDIRTVALKNISTENDVFLNKLVYHNQLRSISKIENSNNLKTSHSLFVDRPFVFIIKEKSTDAIIFIGQIIDP